VQQQAITQMPGTRVQQGAGESIGVVNLAVRIGADAGNRHVLKQVLAVCQIVALSLLRLLQHELRVGKFLEQREGKVQCVIRQVGERNRVRRVPASHPLCLGAQLRHLSHPPAGRTALNHRDEGSVPPG